MCLIASCYQPKQNKLGLSYILQQTALNTELP